VKRETERGGGASWKNALFSAGRETLARSKKKKKLSKKPAKKQTTNTVNNLTIGKAINATVYKVSRRWLLLFQKSEQKGAGKRGESVEKRGKKKADPEK
jgi:hypothetical protein